MKQKRINLIELTIVAVVTVIVFWMLTSDVFGECLDFVPPPLFDTSDNSSADPRNPRVHGSETIQWNGHRYIFYNIGNDLAYRRLDDPLNPGTQYESRFKPPLYWLTHSDRDYNLFNFSICDNCRFGIAGFEMAGTGIFDLGTGSSPSWLDLVFYEDWGVQGGFTFSDGDQYLIVNNHPDGCVGKPTLFLWGALETPQNIQCLNESFAVQGGFGVPPNYLYIVDGNQRVRIYSFSGSGAGLRLVYHGSPILGFWVHGRGVRIEENRLITARATGIELWDITDRVNPAKIHQWATPVSYANIAAIEWPYAFTAKKGSSAAWVWDLRTYSEVDPEFWDGSLPWNSYDRSSFMDAEIVDGHIFVSRFSVLERFSLCDDLIFADGFESGDTGAWNQ